MKFHVEEVQSLLKKHEVSPTKPPNKSDSEDDESDDVVETPEDGMENFIIPILYTYILAFSIHSKLDDVVIINSLTCSFSEVDTFLLQMDPPLSLHNLIRSSLLVSS